MMKQTIHTLSNHLKSVENRLRMANVSAHRQAARIDRLEGRRWWKLWR